MDKTMTKHQCRLKVWISTYCASKYPQYNSDIWVLIYGCLTSLISLDNYGNTLNELKYITLDELITFINELAEDRWGEAANSILNIYGVESSQDIKNMCFEFIDAGFIPNRIRLEK